VSRYEVRFSATNPDDVASGTAERLGEILATLPDVDRGQGARLDGPRRVSGAFGIEVEQAMAEAARDGSRLAKEALGMAGMPESKLVELVVRLVDDSG